MSITLLIFLAACVLIIAVLYSSVGHGGASGYIAVMVLFGVAPSVIKPTALLLNIVVSAITAIYFFRAGHFSWRLFWPFAITSIPCSFIGGATNLPPHIYNPLVGIILLFSAYRLFSHQEESITSKFPLLPTALSVGAILGLLSGLTGVGGGIFLSPLLLLMRWGKAKTVAAVAALFILVNSVAGLMGHMSGLQVIPHFAPLLAAVALGGGVAGAIAGSRHMPAAGIVRALAIVLGIAGAKLMFI